MKRTILVIAISFTSGFLSHKLVVEKTSTTHKKATALTQSSELTPSVKNLSTHDIEIKLQKEIDEIKDKNNTLRIKLSEALSELSKKEKNAIRQREDLGNEILQAKEKGRIPTPHNLLDIAENFDSESLQNHFKNESVDHNWAYSQQEALTHFFQETPLLSDNVIYENTCKKTLCRLSISTSDINEFSPQLFENYNKESDMKLPGHYVAVVNEATGLIDVFIARKENSFELSNN